MATEKPSVKACSFSFLNWVVWVESSSLQWDSNFVPTAFYLPTYTVIHCCMRGTVSSLKGSFSNQMTPGKGFIEPACKNLSTFCLIHWVEAISNKTEYWHSVHLHETRPGPNGQTEICPFGSVMGWFPCLSAQNTISIIPYYLNL